MQVDKISFQQGEIHFKYIFSYSLNSCEIIETLVFSSAFVPLVCLPHLAKQGESPLEPPSDQPGNRQE